MQTQFAIAQLSVFVPGFNANFVSVTAIPPFIQDSETRCVNILDNEWQYI
jgi:hypothetical protein